MKFIYMLAGGDKEHELALAEACAVADALPIARKLVETDRPIDIARTGYVAAGIELIAAGATLDETCRRLAERGLVADGFGLEVVRIPRGLKLARHETADALGRVITGRPNLSEPSERFLAFATSEGFWFGRKLDAKDYDWLPFVRKPHDSSSALSSCTGRAVCNLVIRGGERVIDPCCGTGTLLLHAAVLGASIAGADINQKMVWATNKNLVHFGFEAVASRADAANVGGRYDLAVTNLPYGKMSAVTDDKLGRIIANLMRLAPRGVVVAASDLSEKFEAVGATLRQTILLPKFSMTRRVYVFESA